MAIKNTHWKPCIEVWMNFYRTRKRDEYVIDGASMRHLKLLLKKIVVKLSQKGMEPTDENIINSLNGYLYSITDTWILDNLELSIVNSKFNVIYSKATAANPFSRSNTIDEIVNAKYGSNP